MENTTILEKAPELSAYHQLPDRLRLKQQGRCEDVAGDPFGVKDRLVAIERVYEGVSLGRIADLGGNSGFFSLSLADSGMATVATVYDTNSSALRAGREMSRALDIEGRVAFEEGPVTLDFVCAMQHIDTVLCLNLIHHAGVLFDVDLVHSIGWEEYARQWLLALRGKATNLIMSVGFKGQKPPCWDIPRSERPARFLWIAKQAGWVVSYDANVHDIRRYGVVKAGGMQTGKAKGKTRVHRLLSRMTSGSHHAGADGDKTHKYHVYMLRHDEQAVYGG